MFDSKNDRFIIKESQSLGVVGLWIIRDNKTGVNYLMSAGCLQYSLTQLLDSHGKVIID